MLRRYTIIAICIANTGVLFSSIFILLLVKNLERLTPDQSSCNNYIKKSILDLVFLPQPFRVFEKPLLLYTCTFTCKMFKFNFFCKFEVSSCKTEIEILKGPHEFLLSAWCIIGLLGFDRPHEIAENHSLLGLKFGTNLACSAIYVYFNGVYKSTLLCPCDIFYNIENSQTHHMHWRRGAIKL